MNEMNEMVKAVSADGTVRITAISARGVVERARQIHDTSPVATAALGRTLCATSIIGAELKEEAASVTVRINGGGPLGTIMAVSDSGGNVRGYAQFPYADRPSRQDGKLDVGGAVGTDGMLTVIRDPGTGAEPYSGSVQLVTGEVAEDFTAYFAESEQTPTAVALGVLVDVDRTVKAAGGYVAQLLPGAPEARITQLEENIQALGYVTNTLASGSPDDLINGVLRGMDPQILSRQEVEYRCYCSRERALAALASLDEAEKQDIRAKGEPVEVTCQFCDAVYTFAPEEIAG
jgi:molecular chaperone Hsp33